MYDKLNINKDGGMKCDSKKPDWSLIDLNTFESVIRVLTYGAKKYEKNNWQKLNRDRIFAAMMRHIKSHQAGEYYDEESGEPHISHVICNAYYLLWFIINNKN